MLADMSTIHRSAICRGKVRRAMLTFLALAGFWALGAAALDRYGVHDDPPGTYDAIVVLGCGVWPGGQASPALERRTRHAVELWRAGKAPRIVFTGGVGEHPPSEAETAAEIARGLGVPDEAMVLERNSTSTEENARFAAAQLGGGRRVLVVTDSYHVFRSQRVFGRHFTEARGVGSVGIRSMRIRGALREVLAVVIYTVFGRMH